VRTYGAKYDVVAALDAFRKKPAIGDIIAGTFWLSGRLLDS